MTITFFEAVIDDVMSFLCACVLHSLTKFVLGGCVPVLLPADMASTDISSYTITNKHGVKLTCISLGATITALQLPDG